MHQVPGMWHPISPSQQSWEVGAIKCRLREFESPKVTRISDSGTSWTQSDSWAYIQNQCHEGRKMWFHEVFAMPWVCFGQGLQPLDMNRPQSPGDHKRDFESIIVSKITPITTPPVNYKPESNATFFLYLPVLREILCVNLRRSKLKKKKKREDPSFCSLWVPPTPPPNSTNITFLCLSPGWYKCGPRTQCRDSQAPPLIADGHKCFPAVQNVRVENELRGLWRRVLSKKVCLSMEQGHSPFLSHAPSQMAYHQERMSLISWERKISQLPLSSVGVADCGFHMLKVESGRKWVHCFSCTPS